MTEVVERLEDPEQIQDPELQELMYRAEDMAAQAYTQETGEVDQAYIEQAEEILNQYEWVQGLEKESGEYDFDL